MEFHGYDFAAFNPLVVSNAKRMEDADDTLARDWNTKVDKTARLSKMTEQMCGLYDDFFCSVLGEDYDTLIGVNTENLDEMTHLYAEFCNTVSDFTAARTQDAVNSLHKAKPADKQAAPAPAPQNRAQRRAARRNKAKHA